LSSKNIQLCTFFNFILKIREKPLDKNTKVWYNIGVVWEFA
jgi:hypothetical protein